MTDTRVAAPAPTERKTLLPSAQDLLKQAVSGSTKTISETKPEAKPEQPTPAVPAGALRRKLFGFVDRRAAAMGGSALALGLVLGAGGTALTVPRGDAASAALDALKAELEAGRAETARLTGDLGRLAGSIARSGERAAEDAKALRADLTQRLAKAEQTLTAKVSALGERQETADRDQSVRLAALGALIEKRSAVAPAAIPAPQAALPTPKANPAEPIQTGSVNETKPGPDQKKATAVSNWAVREVYDGIAVLEDRKRRLVEVARGDMVPGVGRAETIERRGRAWVVVTREGVITPQDW